MNTDIELPKLKEDKLDDLYKNNITELQTVLLSKIEENRKLRQMINSNVQIINNINYKLETLNNILDN